MSRWRKAVDWLEQRLNLTEVVSFFTTFGIVYTDWDVRKPVVEAIRETFTRRMPTYARWPYVLGVLTFLLFILQGVTGLLLAFYYQPTPEAAYDSTLLIVRDTHFGWYIHQMHAWGSTVLIFLLGIRLLRFFVQGVYKKPRELFWVFGAILFLLAIHGALTGTLLPWDQMAYWSVTRSLEIIRALPLVGPMLEFLVGGFELNAATLTRFYILHIVFIPSLMLVFFYLHFATVRRVGLSPPLRQAPVDARPLYPDHFLYLLILSLLLFGVILTLGVLFPAHVWVEADPFRTPEGIRPPWYLLPGYGLIEVLPDGLAGVLLLLALVAMPLLPFFDRGPGRRMRERPLISLLVLVVLVAMLFFGYLGYRYGG